MTDIKAHGQTPRRNQLNPSAVFKHARRLSLIYGAACSNTKQDATVDESRPDDAEKVQARKTEPTALLRPVGAFGAGLFGADWKVSASNASFMLKYNGSWANMTGVTFR